MAKKEKTKVYHFRAGKFTGVAQGTSKKEAKAAIRTRFSEELSQDAIIEVERLPRKKFDGLGMVLIFTEAGL